MNKYAKVASISICLASLLTYWGAAMAQQSAVTAVDIALEPDTTMVQHAEAVNARLRSVFPKGFSLDASHHPHISMLQRYVRTADLAKIYAAAGKVFDSYHVTGFKIEGLQILLPYLSVAAGLRLIGHCGGDDSRIGEAAEGFD
jgi:hypothetical protein